MNVFLLLLLLLYFVFNVKRKMGLIKQVCNKAYDDDMTIFFTFDKQNM